MIHRLKYWLWEKAHPNQPWMCPGTIEFLQTHLSNSMSGLEFGSGRSSIWFGQLVGHLTSVEYNSDWYEALKVKLTAENLANVDLRLIRLDHPESAPEEDYSECPSYVAILDEFDRETLDFVIVDGHYRTQCTRKCLNKIKPGGYLLIDDTNRWDSLDSLKIPQDWLVVDRSSNGLKSAIIWQKPPHN